VKWYKLHHKLRGYIYDAKCTNLGSILNFGCIGGDRPSKVIKIQPKHFVALLMANDKNCTPKTVGMFRALNRVIWLPVSTFHAPAVLGPETIVEICPRLFLPVRIKTARNASQIVWVYFSCQKWVIQTRFSTLTAPVVLEPEKVVKIRPKHFQPYWSQNDKNCVPNKVGMFLVQNWVIHARFSTFPTPVVPSPEKSSKLNRIIFQPYWRETIEIAP